MCYNMCYHLPKWRALVSSAEAAGKMMGSKQQLLCYCVVFGSLFHSFALFINENL